MILSWMEGRGFFLGWEEGDLFSRWEEGGFFSLSGRLGIFPLGVRRRISPWVKEGVFSQWCETLQRQNAKNLKQIFPEKEYQGLSPNFHIHVSVSALYIPTMGLPFLLEEI